MNSLSSRSMDTPFRTFQSIWTTTPHAGPAHPISLRFFPTWRTAQAVTALDIGPVSCWPSGPVLDEQHKKKNECRKLQYFTEAESNCWLIGSRSSWPFRRSVSVALVVWMLHEHFERVEFGICVWMFWSIRTTESVWATKLTNFRRLIYFLTIRTTLFGQLERHT